MDISTIATALQSGLSVVGFFALSVWMMKWAKGLHDRNKELGEIDKEIRTALRDSFAVQKELHEIERKKLEVELANVSNDVVKKSDAIDEQKKILQLTIMAVDVADSLIREIHDRHIAIESGASSKNFLSLMDLLHSSGLVKKETFYALDMKAPVPHGATQEEEIAWRLLSMHDENIKIFAHASAIACVTPAAVRFILKNPDISEQDIQYELRKVMAAAIRQLKSA